MPACSHYRRFTLRCTGVDKKVRLRHFVTDTDRHATVDAMLMVLELAHRYPSWQFGNIELINDMGVVLETMRWRP